MRIVIDLQGAQTASRFRGIGRYSTALARGIVRQAGSHEIWLVLNGALEDAIAQVRADFDGLVAPERIKVFQIPGHVAEVNPSNAARRAAAALLREQFIALLEPDIVLVTSLFEGYLDNAVGSVGTFIDGRRTAVILYDLIPLLNPDSYLADAYVRRCYMHKIASLERAGLLLAISDHAGQEAVAALDLPQGRVIPISTAVDESFAPGALTPAELEAVRQRFGVARAMLLYAPGGYDPRKNVQGLIAAYGMLTATLRQTHQLVIVSKLSDDVRASLLAHAAACGLGSDELVLTGYVSDADLIALYQAATLFVFPSLHEGFGMPALEAMACGTPAIGSNTTSIPEVIGLDEAMFDPRQPRAIADKISAVLSDADLYARLRAHGRRQAARFSWDATAQRALRALEAQVAATPATTAREPGALLDALLAVPGLGADDESLVWLATCLAALPNPATPRQWLIDVSGLTDADTGMLSAPAWDPMKALLRNRVAKDRIAPVYLSGRGGVWHYRYANVLAARLLGADTGEVTDPVADLHAGDVVLCAGQAPQALAQARDDGLLDHLHRIGVAWSMAHDAQTGACGKQAMALPADDDADAVRRVTLALSQLASQA